MVRAGITFVLGRAVWRSLGSDRILRMEQNRVESGGRDGGGGSGTNASPSTAGDFPGNHWHLRPSVNRGPLGSFGGWQRLSRPPEPSQSWILDGEGPKPSAASRPSALSRGPSPLFSSYPLALYWGCVGSWRA